ncbi:amidohydrolase [Thalassotalea ponticola]|uniref:amidohydrolase n=1 Tax=Thalassotalea ponticola TaxID=1523392 RepID=UPI0025B61F57|nr:amidohydrolase [Thalassotalea ponticola]MDN3652048.1 amidohydrolase [Thalassotalea ponticola]
MSVFKKTCLAVSCFIALHTNIALAQPISADALANEVEQDVIQWRRHFHQHPELSNREFATSERIAKELKAMGLEVTTGIAHTGVVAVLDSGKPGPVVALRADIDALPVKEQNDLPFASQAMGEYNNQQVPVMHACGHDTHIAMLLGAAKVLSQHKQHLNGKVKFIFQPAEEGAPAGEEGGAELMVKQGVMNNPDVDVIFGLHIWSNLEIGKISYKPGGTLAAVDTFKIVVNGKQAHGAYPWKSVDPIVTAAQIVMSLQTIVSRELKLIDEAAVVTVGSINGGVRSNIIPNQVELVGTLRSLNPEMRQHIREAVRRKAVNIAESMGATVDITLPFGADYPVTYNEPELMAQMLPLLQRNLGADNVVLSKAQTGAEDFSFFQQQVPGLFLGVGGMPKGMDSNDAPAHHTPEFYIDEGGLKTGVQTLIGLTLDYMQANQ